MREILATTALLALVVATPAMGQTSTAAADEKPVETPQADEAPPQDGDVVVTARRREESIRDVPGTISAVTADQLEAKGPVTSGGDLLNSVPGVRFNDVASENLAEVSVRGSGTARATGADSGVGLFVNGAYVGSSTLGGRNFKTLDYFDLERVEVLEGPQGALYGRNSEFGVVNIVLAKPKFQNSGYVRGTYTFDQGQARVAGVINAVSSDSVAFRFGAELYGQSKGFYYNPRQDKYYDQTKGITARAQMRYRSGSFDATLLIDGQDLKLPTFTNSFVVAPGTNAALPLGFVQSRFILPHEGLDGMQQTVLRSMLLMSYDFGWGTLESTTMATRWRSSQQFAAAIDYDTLVSLRRQNQLGAYPFGQTTTDVVDRTLYQDLHLTGKAAGGNLTWIAGLEALYQNDNYQLTIGSSPCAFTLVAQAICSGTPTAPVCSRPLTTSLNCPATFPLAFGTDSRTKQRIYSMAAYASLQYTAGNLSLVGEARLSHDYKTATQFTYALHTTNFTRVPTTFAYKADQPAYTFTASYKVPGATRTLLYAKVGTGYRAGGVNNGAFNAAAPNPFAFTYDNESTIGYEAGIKSNLTNSIFVRLSGYLSRTSDAITSIADGCTLTNACLSAQQIFNTNGGTIHARGVEAAIDGRWRVGEGLFSLGLNAATQRAYFAKVPVGVTGLPTLGSSVAQIPDWTMSATADFRQPIARDLNGFINLSYSGQRGGAQDTVTTATPSIPLSDFDIFNARTGLSFGKTQLALSVRNLFDREIQVLKFMQGAFPLSVRYNRPRTFALTLSHRW